MNTNEAATAMIGGAVGVFCGERHRWSGQGFQYYGQYRGNDGSEWVAGRGESWCREMELPPAKTGWSIEHPEGSREWAQEKVKQIDPKTGERYLVRQPNDRTVVFGHDSEGFYFRSRTGQGIRDRHAPSLAGTGSHCATGWSIYEPKPEPKPPGRVVRLLVTRGGTFPQVRLSGAAYWRVVDINPDSVASYVYRRPDGTERIEPQLTACWYTDHNARSIPAAAAAHRNYKGCTLAPLTHVLWLREGEGDV